MEGKIELTIEQYNGLIRENEKLKTILSRYQHQMREELTSYVLSGSIHRLTEEECNRDLSGRVDDESLVCRYAQTDCVIGIVDRWTCFSPKEVERTIAGIIRREIVKRIRYLQAQKR